MKTFRRSLPPVMIRCQVEIIVVMGPGVEAMAYAASAQTAESGLARAGLAPEFLTGGL